MKCIFIYNPNSGKGKLLKKLDFIKNTLLKKYDTVDMYPTSSREDTINIAYEACTKYDEIIFAGGDGTFNDITNSVLRNDVRPPLGYIPCGTCNDIAKNLKISKNVKKALKVIIEGKPYDHDAGYVNHKYFMYVCGAGTFTSISYKTKQKIKRVLGRIAYALDGMKELASPTIINGKMIIDGNEVEIKNSPLVLVLNSISIAGIPFNKKRGHVNDGYFDVIVVKKFWGYLTSIFRLFLFGTLKKKDHTKYYDFYRGKNIKIETADDVKWTIDGEEGPSGSIDIKNLHYHLKIYANEKAKVFKKDK
jgi:YegS/Rv2252/BmrU family lipid kinase